MVPPKPSCWRLVKLGTPQDDAFMFPVNPCDPCSAHLGDLTRWLTSVKYIKVKFMTASATECLWRRMQVSDQQSERQKKSVLQKALTFTSRARELMVQDPWGYYIYLLASHGCGNSNWLVCILYSLLCNSPSGQDPGKQLQRRLPAGCGWIQQLWASYFLCKGENWCQHCIAALWFQSLLV